MSKSKSSSSTLRFQGCANFRQRVVSATLCGKGLRIDEIRSGEDDELNPGLQDFEASFLRLIEKLTDGFRVEINESGTSMRYKPGIIVGGQITHDCGGGDIETPSKIARSVGWFIEGIIPLALFAKKELNLKLTGITNDSLDLSVDTLINVTLPLLRNFGISGSTLKVIKRGAAPLGGGEVDLYIPQVRNLRPIFLIEMGLIKRVRGVAFCTRVSPTLLSRVVSSSREVLNNILPDVHIHTDHYKGKEGGLSAGYSLALVAESTTGVLLSIQRTAGDRGEGELPEDVGREASLLLLEEIRRGGVIDSSHQCLVLQLMVLGPEDVCKVRFGYLTDQAIMTLRLLKESFGVVFKVKEEKETGTILLSCLGIGFQNMSRRIA
jgi:RNA 3'-terminal phosphate cyclase-like protein